MSDTPSTRANARRNARAEPDRAARWRPAREAAWRLLEPHLHPDAAVLVVGAGNADDLPLTRLLARAGRVDLLDIDRAAPAAALRREPRALRRRGRAVAGDATGGAADRAAAAAFAGSGDDIVGVVAGAPPAPLGEGPYDLAIGDLLYTQLLYPALLDAGLAGDAIDAALLGAGQTLTDLAVARLHASAPVVAHLHDPLAWWSGHPQPVTLEEVLAAAARSHAAADALVASGDIPLGCDLEGAVDRAGATVIDRAWWRWPFLAGVDYLVRAVVARGQSHPPG